nr:neprilysin-3-like [Nomia melanderi]
MTRTVWILIFTGIVADASIRDYPLNLGWLFDRDSEPGIQQSKEERSLCETPECVALAKIVTENMDTSVDPCDNFYEYACGNWEKHNPLPEGLPSWSPMMRARELVNQRLLDIIQEKSKSDDVLGLKLSRRAYNACMDTDELERRGVQPLISSLWRIGGWPLIMDDDEWDEELYKWQYVDDYYAHLTGLNALHDVQVSAPWDSETEGEEKFLVVNTPHIPYKSYLLVSSREIDWDSSDENNDSGGGSEERGSEERGRKDDNSEENEGEDEDSQEKKLVSRINKKLAVNRRKSGKRKLSETHAEKRTKRTKRAAIRSKDRKHHEWTKVNDQGIRHDKRADKLSHNKKVSVHISGKTRLKNHDSRRNGKNGRTNDDIYFDNPVTEDEDSDENENENDSEDSNDEEGGEDRNDSNDEDDWGSGNGSGDGSDDEDSDYDDRDEKERKRIEELRSQYKKFMLNVTMALVEARGVEISEEKIRNNIDDLLEFQLSLIRLIYTDHEQGNLTVAEFQARYDDLKPVTNNGKINWLNKLQSLFTTAGLSVDNDTRILTISRRYMKGLRQLLDNTPSRIIVNYIHWNFINRAIKGTTQEMRDFYYNWYTNEERSEKRSMQCIEDLEAKYCLGYEYVKRYFSDKWLQAALDMISDIQKEVEYRVEESTWMDDATKEYILDKLVYMKALIGYPPQYRNATIMQNHFRGLSISKSHYENMLGVMRYKKRDNLRSLNTTMDVSNEAFIDPLVVNAFYIPGLNLFEITAADFQSPMYGPNQPWYTNFGILGFIMAHEVNHGFDDSGRMFDKHGEFAEWLSAMAEAYEDRADCFREQYTKYSVEQNRTANIQIEDYGSQTSGENIADTMGLQAVFGAYQRRLRKCKVPDPMLPGLQNFTNNQMFFLSAANVWCTTYDMEKLKGRLKHDPHSPGPLRVIGSLSNSEDFAKAYNCPEGSFMNPKKKCNIWK